MNPFRTLLTNPPATKAEKIRVTKLGDKLPLYADAWDALSANFPTRQARRAVRDHYAALLGVDPRTLNSIAKPEFQRPDRIKEIHGHYLEVSAQKLAIMRGAISFIAGSDTAESAALTATTTQRTLYRRVDTLLAAEGLVISDLKRMTNQQRVELAQRFESSVLKIREQRHQKIAEKAMKTREIRTKKT